MSLFCIINYALHSSSNVFIKDQFTFILTRQIRHLMTDLRGWLVVLLYLTYFFVKMCLLCCELRTLMNYVVDTAAVLAGGVFSF